MGHSERKKQGGTVLGRNSGQPLVGLDLVEVGRFERALACHPRLLERVFTPAEIAYCKARSRPGLHLAARFAAKEAVGKLLGQGVVVWRDIEVTGPEARPGVSSAGLASGPGAPRVVLHGGAAEAARRKGIAGISVSISHVDSMAAACVVALSHQA